MKAQIIPITRLQCNIGQIPGLPKNPRIIRDERYQRLLQSLRDLPEMMDLRELIVFPLGEPYDQPAYVVIGGNMRLTGCQELKWDQVPCKVLPASTSLETLKQITIKDNVGYGDDDFDALNADWDMDELEAWGMELADVEETDDDELEPPAASNMAHQKQIRLNFSEKDYLKVKEQLSKIAETPELAVWILLGNKAAG